MFTSTVLTTALLFTTTLSSVNAIPIWSRLPFARRDAALTPDQLAQGSNYFFDSLRLEDACTPGQVACISSNLASCSGEGNWEITPCTGNNTCLAVPDTDNGVVVQCMRFTDAQADIGSQQVSVDFNVTAAPFNTTASPTTVNATETATATGSGNSTVPTATATATDSASDPAPTDPSTNSTTATATATATATDALTNATTTPTANATATDPVDPSATCTDDAPEVTETELITVVISPDPTQSGVFDTTTLFPTPDVTGTTVETSIPFPNATATNDPAGSATADPAPTTGTNGTSDPNATDPNATDSSSSSSPDPTDAPTTTANATSTDTPAAQTGITLTIPPNFSVPGSTPTSSGGDVAVLGTHFVTADPSPTPGRMVRRKIRVE